MLVFPRLGKDAPGFQVAARHTGGRSLDFPSAGAWVLAFVQSWNHPSPQAAGGSGEHGLDELQKPSVLSALEQLGASLLLVSSVEMCELRYGFKQVLSTSQAQLRAVSEAYAVDHTPPTGAVFLIDAGGVLRFAHYMSVGRTPTLGMLSDALLSAWREFSSSPGSVAIRSNRKIACLASELMARLVGSPEEPESRALSAFASSTASAFLP